MRMGESSATSSGAAADGGRSCWRRWGRWRMLETVNQSRPVAASLDELLAGATYREPLTASDSKSEVTLERVTIEGRPHVLKHVHIDDDWTMRFFAETTCIPLEVWRTGMMDVLPERIDHTVVAVAGGLGRDGLGAALLMRDAGSELLPAGDDPVRLDQHHQLLDEIAALPARTWGWSG